MGSLTKRKPSAERGEGATTLLPPSPKAERKNPAVELLESPPTLLSYEEIHMWRQDNPHIRRGYRPLSNSAEKCLASWGYLHNETVNIYSHLLPVILLVIIGSVAYHCFLQRYPSAATADLAVFTFWLLSALSYLWGLCVGHPNGLLLRAYTSYHLLDNGTLTGLVLLNPRFHGQRYRSLRLGAFVTTGLSAVAPIIHGIIYFGYSQLVRQSGLMYYLIEGLIILLGVFCYGTRLPESVAPGRFDTWGASHQIFHILVVIATAVHFVGLHEAYEYNCRYRTCGLA